MGLLGPDRSDRRMIIDPATGREFVESTPGVVVTDHPTHSDSAAYAAGKADARAADRQRELERRPAPRRRGFPLLGLIVLLVALLGVTWLVLAYRTGSFAGAGAVVDNQVAGVKQSADEAKLRTGQAVENAGQALKNQGEKIKK